MIVLGQGSGDLTALTSGRSLPLFSFRSLFGGVDFEAFRRLASIFLDEAGGFLPTPVVVAVGLWVFWLAIPFS